MLCYRLLLVIHCIIFLTPLLTQAQSTYYPSRNGAWETRSPEDMGLNADQLQQAVSFALDNEYEGDRDLKVAILKGFAQEPYHDIAGPTRERGGPAGMILKDGYVVAQWGDVERVDMTFSVTKSYLSTVAGLALEEGLIENVDDSVVSYVWDGTFDGAHNSKITWDHLLTQSSDWYGSLFGMTDWTDRPPSEGGLDEWRNRELQEPGTYFEYNDVRVNLLAYSLLQVWRKPLPMVLKEKIMDPIGASSTWRWYGYENSFVNIDGIKMQSVSGGGHSGGGVFISTLDHARFGLLFLRRGQWEGEQLISEDWIDQITQSSAANESYGYMWWLNRGDRAWEGVDSSVYYAAGFGGNFIVVDNEHDLVIVTRWLNPPQIGEMVRMVMESVE
uniref:Serine hydrolase n=1 Tax=Roseihalotalea indica TaxID=2867963 RepID=A0AA49JJE2_9BACT|nr:serine hydrolase [Tunicatimonas sp. TK19036]